MGINTYFINFYIFSLNILKYLILFIYLFIKAKLKLYGLVNTGFKQEIKSLNVDDNVNLISKLCL
jgi:hypothetical protein